MDLTLLILHSTIHLFYLYESAVAATNSSMKKNTIKNLRRDLLIGYDSLARPVTNFSKMTVVKMSFFPMHVTELNEEQGIIITEGFLDVTWQDDHLQWDPRNYEGIKKVNFQQFEIWKPDIFVFEGRGSEVDPLNDKVHLYVNNSGHVFWTPPATIHSVCQLDYDQYPHDTQECMVTFGSWVQDGKFVDIEFLYEDTEMTIDDSSPTNPLWKVSKITMRRKTEMIPSATNGEEESYVSLEYVIYLERRIDLSQRVAVVPKVVAILLHLSMFWLPANSEKKLILGTSALLLQTLTMLYIGVSLPTPAAAQVALTSTRAELASGVAAVVFQIAILNIALVKSFSPPIFIKRLNSGLISQILCLCTVGMTSQASDTSELVDGPGAHKNDENECLLLATLLDRFLFPIFSIIFMVENSL